jgi:fructose-bisphosphate aldolase class 1
MSIEQLAETARAMVAPGKGIIAIDESASTCQKRFDGVGIESSEENRRAYRELLLTAPNANQYLSGAILFDETIRQSTRAGVPFAKYMADNGMIPGIKVDKGTHPLAGFPGELITEGLDGLRDRLKEYYKLGARFAKWRAVINIGEDIPSGTCIEANSHALARYAALCQEQGLVPMVEPEVLMDGASSCRTRSRSPTSMPSSSTLVAAITQSRPCSNSRSASWRWAADSEPCVTKVVTPAWFRNRPSSSTPRRLSTNTSRFSPGCSCLMTTAALAGEPT